MPYNYNPHQHIRIWLSPQPEFFLTLENQLRLVKLRTTNPKDKIHFIYDSQLLSTKALEQLFLFCTRYAIATKNVRDVKPSNQID